eukprot:GHRR01023287.1.p1 GENE.GHRR01023287.1~~GHRR01023287.1.p1  ORF type:complete len:524 (-),score=165.34 GHRR01023287.1:201-1772(-)
MGASRPLMSFELLPLGQRLTGRFIQAAQATVEHALASQRGQQKHKSHILADRWQTGQTQQQPQRLACDATATAQQQLLRQAHLWLPTSSQCSQQCNHQLVNPCACSRSQQHSLWQQRPCRQQRWQTDQHLQQHTATAGHSMSQRAPAWSSQHRAHSCYGGQQWQSLHTFSILLCQPQHITTTIQRLQQPVQGHRWLHQSQQHPDKQQQDTPDQPSTAVSTEQNRPRQVTGASFATLPNLLSLSRVVTAPFVAYVIATQQWPLALSLTAAAGATDWLDGYLARRMGHTSKVGSYLDPFSDKVYVAAAVGTMGYLGMLPGWLAVLVIGRDTAQVAGFTWYRLRTFGWKWPGAAKFLDGDGVIGSSAAASPDTSEGKQQPGSTATCGGEAGQATYGSSNVVDMEQDQQRDCSSSASQQLRQTASSSAAGGTGSTPGYSEQEQGGSAAAIIAPGDLPVMQPLLVSKLNTALIMILVAGSMLHQWQGLPGQDVLDMLEGITAGTTAVSALAYIRLIWLGRLVPLSVTV